MANSTGLNRWTWRALSDFDHVRQSIADIFTTRIGERIMRRTYGSMVPAILGRPLDQRTILRFYSAVVYAIALWEPRFRITQIDLPNSQNDPETMRGGKLSTVILGHYMPNALKGDFTPEPTPRKVVII